MTADRHNLMINSARHSVPLQGEALSGKQSECEARFVNRITRQIRPKASPDRNLRSEPANNTIGAECLGFGIHIRIARNIAR